MQEPEWTKENIDKKRGDTTFKRCGWCEHRGSGSYRNDCMLDGRCPLLKSHAKRVQWDTECIIKQLGKQDIESLVGNKEYTIRENREAIQRAEAAIAILHALSESAPSSPALAKNREHDHFNTGDGVFFYYQGEWIHGTVTKGYRSHDGCVSYVVDGHPETQEIPWGAGCRTHQRSKKMK